MTMFGAAIVELVDVNGTGAFTLKGAVSGRRAFSAEFTNGQLVSYFIRNLSPNDTEWEEGMATFSTGPDTLTRSDANVTRSSNSNNRVAFTTTSNVQVFNAPSGTIMAGMLNTHLGTTEPLWKEDGVQWIDNTANPWIKKIRINGAWVECFRFDTTDLDLSHILMSDTHAPWDLANYNAIELSDQGAVYGVKGGTQCGIGSNFYLAAAAAPKYKAAGFASRIRFNSGDIIFEAAASGAADGAITWVSPLVWDYAGDVVAFRDVTNAEMIRFQYDGTQIQVRPIISTSSSVPTYSWQGDTDTGFHRGGSNKIQVICGGVVAANFVAEGVAFGPSWVGSAQPISNATWGAVSDESRVVGTFEAKHASQASSIVQMRADRASSTAYNFLQCLSNDAVSDDNEFVLKGDGNGTCDGGWTGGGADYAEMFEWADGNPSGQDRVGYSVALVGDKIKIAEPGDIVVGAISGAYTALGDAAGLKWTGRYEKDDFGRYVMEDYEVVEWVEVKPAEFKGRQLNTGKLDKKGKPIFKTEREESVGERKKTRSYALDNMPTDVTPPANAKRTTQQRRKHNPGFDPAVEYTPRVDRQEWDAVGLMGKLRIRKGQQINPGWTKLKDISATVELWLVR